MLPNGKYPCKDKAIPIPLPHLKLNRFAIFLAFSNSWCIRVLDKRGDNTTVRLVFKQK